MLSRTVLGTCHWPFPVFKYVDVAHADAVASGSMKIGTLRGYGQIEGQRRDDEEATVLRKMGALFTGNPEHREIIEALGIKLPAVIPNHVTLDLRGATIRTVGPDAYCYCLSTSPDVADPIGVKQAVFKITDTPGWLEAIGYATANLGPFRCARVRYESREATLEKNSAARPNPFIKPERFSWEREVRVVWSNTDVHQLPTLEIMPASPNIAKWIERIR